MGSAFSGPEPPLGVDTVVRIATAAAAIVGPCDHCKGDREPTEFSSDQTITLVSLHRGDETVLTARFCERHFLLFSDLVSDQVAALLYPKRVTPV